jgi:hypothetical protein
MQRASRTSLQELMLLHVSFNSELFCILSNIMRTNPLAVLRKSRKKHHFRYLPKKTKKYLKVKIHRDMIRS